MEKDVRLDVINSILKTPHKKIEDLIDIHTQCVSIDPLFYVKFALWYSQNGSVRDHNKLFAAGTITSPFTELRFIGVELMNTMSAKDLNETVSIAASKFKGKSGGKQRLIRSAVERFLRGIEERSEKDGGYSLLMNANFIRNMYRFQQIAPEARTAASLRFKSSAKPYKYFSLMKELAHTTDEEAICRLISENNMPFLQVMGSLKKLTPAIAVALVSGMTPNQIVNSMSMFEKKGLLDIPEFKKIINDKMKKGATKKDASLRSSAAAKKVSKAADILDSHSDKFVESLQKIDKKVLLAIDKSFSMVRAIEVGKDISAILASKVVNPNENLKVVTFNNTVQLLNIKECMSYTDFDNHFRYITANGTTAVGAPIKACEKMGFAPDVFIFVTDCEEGSPPHLEKSIADSPAVDGAKFIFCLVGDKVYDPKISSAVVAQKGIEVETIRFTGDYYSLPNLIKLIATGGVKDLIELIDSIDPFTFFKKAA